jgi:hypothetical protein
MENGHVFTDGHCRDQTIDETSNGLATAPTTPVEHRRGVKIRWLAMHHARTTEQPAKLVKMQLIAGASENLHEDGIADGNIGIQQTVDLVADL